MSDEAWESLGDVVARVVEKIKEEHGQ